MAVKVWEPQEAASLRDELRQIADKLITIGSMIQPAQPGSMGSFDNLGVDSSVRPLDCQYLDKSTYDAVRAKVIEIMRKGFSDVAVIAKLVSEQGISVQFKCIDGLVRGVKFDPTVLTPGAGLVGKIAPMIISGGPRPPTEAEIAYRAAQYKQSNPAMTDQQARELAKAELTAKAQQVQMAIPEEIAKLPPYAQQQVILRAEQLRRETPSLSPVEAYRQAATEAGLIAAPTPTPSYGPSAPIPMEARPYGVRAVAGLTPIQLVRLKSAFMGFAKASSLASWTIGQDPSQASIIKEIGKIASDVDVMKSGIVEPIEFDSELRSFGRDFAGMSSWPVSEQRNNVFKFLQEVRDAMADPVIAGLIALAVPPPAVGVPYGPEYGPPVEVPPYYPEYAPPAPEMPMAEPLPWEAYLRPTPELVRESNMPGLMRIVELELPYDASVERLRSWRESKMIMGYTRAETDEALRRSGFEVPSIEEIEMPEFPPFELAPTQQIEKIAEEAAPVEQLIPPMYPTAIALGPMPAVEPAIGPTIFPSTSAGPAELVAPAPVPTAVPTAIPTVSTEQVPYTPSAFVMPTLIAGRAPEAGAIYYAPPVARFGPEEFGAQGLSGIGSKDFRLRVLNRALRGS